MESVTANDGNVLHIDSMPISINNNLDGTLKFEGNATYWLIGEKWL